MLRLLAVLWIMVQCSASQQHPSADLNFTPDQLWRFIEQAVKSEIQPLMTKLAPRMDTLDSRLYRLDSRLDTLDSRLDVLDSRVDALTARLHSHDSQLDEQATKLDSQQSQVDVLTIKVESQLDGLVTRLVSQQSQLDEMVTRLDSQHSQLDGVVNRLDSQQFQLDGLFTRLDSQQSQLDGLVTRLDSQQSQLDGLASQLDDQGSRVDELATKTDNQQTQIDGMTTQLDQFQTEPSTPAPLPRDCSELPAGAQSGVHLLQPGLGRSVPMQAYCDLDTDGGNWTVIQRRVDSQPRQDFYLGWEAYREGFGELDVEFWWGLEHVWAMTSSLDRRYELRIDMEDFDGEKRHAVYQGFRITSEADGYLLKAANCTGDAGDSLGYHIGQRFSTKDKDQDSNGGSCAQHSKGAWWYRSCYRSNLNGRYLFGPTSGQVGVSWHHWRGTRYSLKRVEMKIRPTKKVQ